MKNSVTSVYMRMRLRADISIAEIFGVGISFIKKTLKTHLDEDNPVRRNSDVGVFSLNEEQIETLQAAVEICPDATPEELQRFIADECKVTVSQTSICHALKKLNLPAVKKRGNVGNFRPTGRGEAL